MTTDTIDAPNLAPIASLVLPSGPELSTKAQRSLAFIEGMRIATADDYQLGADELQGIKAKWAKLEEQRTAITKPINDALRAVNALFKGPQDLLKRAEDLLKGKLIGYDNEQRRIAAEAQRKADEEARRQREAQEAEARRLQEAAAAAALAAANAAAKGDTQTAAIENAKAQRAQDESNVAATSAQLVVAAPVVAEVPKVKGLSTATTVDFEVTSLHDLAAHIVAHPELINLLEANDKAIRQYVKGVGAACKLPGVRVFERQTMRAGA